MIPCSPKPLHESRDRVTTIEAMLATPVTPLDALTTSAPGAYVLLYRGDLPMYERLRRPNPSDLRSISEAGGAPIYIGSAESLRERRQRHENNLQPCIDISAEDLLVVALPTDSAAGALYTERLLMDVFKPVWNQSWISGFGSKAQGATRTKHQRVPKWSVLHPGRHLAIAATDPTQQQALRQRVHQYLDAAVPDPFQITTPRR